MKGGTDPEIGRGFVRLLRDGELTNVDPTIIQNLLDGIDAEDNWYHIMEFGKIVAGDGTVYVFERHHDTVFTVKEEASVIERAIIDHKIEKALS